MSFVQNRQRVDGAAQVLIPGGCAAFRAVELVGYQAACKLIGSYKCAAVGVDCGVGKNKVVGCDGAGIILKTINAAKIVASLNTTGVEAVGNFVT